MVLVLKPLLVKVVVLVDDPETPPCSDPCPPMVDVYPGFAVAGPGSGDGTKVCGACVVTEVCVVTDVDVDVNVAVNVAVNVSVRPGSTMTV